jgi:hypothetical protein
VGLAYLAVLLLLLLLLLSLRLLYNRVLSPRKRSPTVLTRNDHVHEAARRQVVLFLHSPLPPLSTR